MFQQAITEKAQAERDEIVRETEQIKKLELDKEENQLLEELYARIQMQIGEIKTENIKKISRETLTLKKGLYKKREEYLDTLIDEVRARLAAFCVGPDYPAYLKRNAEALAARYSYDNCVLRVRPQDMAHAEMLRAAYSGCTVEADGDAAITIGGLVLSCSERGLEVDSSLDAALREERERFYKNVAFQIDPAGGAKLESE